MTPAERDDLAKLAYALARDLPRREAKALLADCFTAQHDLTDDMAWALFVRGKSLARQLVAECASKKGRPPNG